MKGLVEILTELVVNVVISGGIASLITYLLSRQQFIRERWWDRRADAYAEIIENLAILEYSLNQWERSLAAEYHEEPGEIVSSDEMDAVQDELMNAKAQIERAASKGTYAISEKAVEALHEAISQMNEKVSEPVPRYAPFVIKSKAVRKCLDVLREEAHEDLKTQIFKNRL